MSGNARHDMHPATSRATTNRASFTNLGTMVIAATIASVTPTPRPFHAGLGAFTGSSVPHPRA